MTEKQRQFLKEYREAADRIARSVLVARAMEDPGLSRFRSLPR